MSNFDESGGGGRVEEEIITLSKVEEEDLVDLTSNSSKSQSRWSVCWKCLTTRSSKKIDWGLRL